jgi:hypothetical protein
MHDLLQKLTLETLECDLVTMYSYIDQMPGKKRNAYKRMYKDYL